MFLTALSQTATASAAVTSARTAWIPAGEPLGARQACAAFTSGLDDDGHPSVRSFEGAMAGTAASLVLLFPCRDSQHVR
jgi:hypothetical protein